MASDAASKVDSSSSEALHYISNDRFHRKFTLEATADHEALNVSYADVGKTREADANPSPPTVLLIPGMFSSRFLGVGVHAIAEKLGVRVLVIDRPGMGSSTDVSLQQRIPVWLELVPCILAHLGIKHVALVSHSAGTMYSLNMLYHCRNLLHPEKPFVALLAPWVDPSHSHMRTFQLAQYLPVKAFGIWHRLPPFFMKAQPAFASSAALVTQVTNAFTFGRRNNDSGGSNDGPPCCEIERNARLREQEYGLSRGLQRELSKLTFKLMFEENTVGANSEALQCLRKGVTWGKCDDYAVFVKDMVDLERSRGCTGGTLKEVSDPTAEGKAKGNANASAQANGETAGEGVAEARARLKVRTYFAEEDALIGKGGQSYVEKCWRGEEEGVFQDVLDFDTKTVAGTDHDTLVQMVEVLEAILVESGGIKDEASESRNGLENREGS
ncbi:Fc.00g010150.m01.CDS01 [Cosmosporella sp. VM-42]